MSNRFPLRLPHILAAVFIVALAMQSAPTSLGATVTLRPSKDNTIYGNGNANLSNGAGAFLFAGNSGERRVLRSLMAFDLAGQIPAGATINSATLTLTITTPLAGNANTVRLHRLVADWGEGASRASMGEGGGAPATSGDATWNHRMFSSAVWTTPGGDFLPNVSASQAVRGNSGPAIFASAGLAADVQAWMSNPASNFGWILVAQDESTAAVRFGSRQGSVPPSLVIDFTPASGGGNTAPEITSQPASQTVAAGGTAVLTVTTIGTPAPTYQWRKDDAAIAGATNATLTLANVTPADTATYSVVATNVAGSVTSAGASLTVTAPGGGGGGSSSTARLANLSVRASMAAGQTLIVGFSVSGGSRSILVRGAGPALAAFGLDGTMADPRLELYAAASAPIAQNDDWNNNTALSAAFTSVGAFGFGPNSRDAALLQSIDGTRSVHLKGTGAGVALVELYDTGAVDTPRLVNVSARNHVGVGDDVLIFGFVIQGTGAKNLLIRAVGPKLTDFGLTGVLADPRLDLFRSGSAVAIAANDNWEASLASTFTSVGAFALNNGSRDAALVTTLSPGAYTVQVSGTNNGTGEALVEIYEVP